MVNIKYISISKYPILSNICEAHDFINYCTYFNEYIYDEICAEMIIKNNNTSW
jgi:hypothetical protein